MYISFHFRVFFLLIHMLIPRELQQNKHVAISLLDTRSGAALKWAHMICRFGSGKRQEKRDHSEGFYARDLSEHVRKVDDMQD